MASLVNDPNGRKRIIFKDEHGKRKTIRLGKVPKSEATKFKSKLEALLKARYLGEMSDETALWINSMRDELNAKLAKLGLVTERVPKPEKKNYTIRQWCDKYIQSRADAKPNTIKNLKDARVKMSDFFGDKAIDEITVADAKSFRIYLKTKRKLAENTIRRMIGRAREYYNAAIDAEILSKNPFRDKALPVTIRANESRDFYITTDMAEKVLEHCPDAQWRLIFGLARYGGLRCPSEILRLKWQDVDFEHDRFTVHASKTEHHENSGIRTVPMFPELRSLFQDAFDNAQEGDIYCITRYRSTAVNLRTQLTKIIKRAGLERWPKLFTNLRSSRETDLYKMTNGNIKAVCKWIGNSPKVALEHYIKVTEADEREAARMKVMGDAEKAAQKAAQQSSEMRRKESQKPPTEKQKTAFSDTKPALCGATQVPGMPETGVELSALKPSKTPLSRSGGAKSGAPDDDLARLIEAWPALSEKSRKAILRIISENGF